MGITRSGQKEKCVCVCVCVRACVRACVCVCVCCLKADVRECLATSGAGIDYDVLFARFAGRYRKLAREGVTPDISRMAFVLSLRGVWVQKDGGRLGLVTMRSDVRRATRREFNIRG